MTQKSVLFGGVLVVAAAALALATWLLVPAFAEDGVWIATGLGVASCFLAAGLIAAAVPRPVAEGADCGHERPPAQAASAALLAEIERASSSSVATIAAFDDALAELGEITQRMKAVSRTQAGGARGGSRTSVDRLSDRGRGSPRTDGVVTLVPHERGDPASQILAASRDLSRQAANLRQEIVRLLQGLRAS